MVPCFRFCPRPPSGSVLQFWLMLQFWTSALVRASVLAVAFCSGPLFQFWPLFRVVRGGSRGAWRPPGTLQFRAPGVTRRLWFAAGRWAPLHSLSPCGVVGLLCSSLPLLVLVLLCCAGVCWWLSFVCLLGKARNLGAERRAWLVTRWPVLLGWFSPRCVCLSGVLLLCPPSLVLSFCASLCNYSSGQV